MSKNYWHDIETGTDIPEIINVIVEIPKGSMNKYCLLYTSPSPRDKRQSRMPSSA